MRRRSSFFTTPRLVIGSAFVLVIAVAVAFSVKHYRAPAAAPPEALAHIAAKNRDAAITAAAHQRAEAAATTNATENLVAAQQPAGAQANAASSGGENGNRAGAAGHN